MTGQRPSYVVPALERGLRMLQAFADGRAVQSLSQLSKELDLPRATAFRLANTLVYMGFLDRNEETGEYRVGPAALGLGWTYLSGLELPEIAHPFLEELRRRSNASVHLAVLDGADIIYVSRLPSNAALASNIRVGSRLPAHASTMGRAILSGLEPELLDDLYGRETELPQFTSQTPSSVDMLRRLLARDAANGGVVISRGYYETGVVSVAAPVHDARNRIVAAVNITASDGRFSDEELENEVRDDVVSAARGISAALGQHKSEATGTGHRVALPNIIPAVSAASKLYRG